MLEPEVETRAWEEQLAVDAASFDEQLAYLLERSALYREKLDGAVPLNRIHELPLTTKQELRAGVTPEDPFGAHYTGAEIVRIYSTSGTTGTPSYIPLTASDLDNWITGSARSYAASGIRAGQRTSPRTTRARSSPAQRWRASIASA
jgi:phenylacetate-CoA ligase